MATICLELVSDVQLEYDISIELSFVEEGASNLTDFNANSSTLTYLFISGSENGTIECDQAVVVSDDIIENREEFVLQSTSISPINSDINFTPSQGNVLAINDSPTDCELMIFNPMGRFIMIPYFISSCQSFH